MTVSWRCAALLGLAAACGDHGTHNNMPGSDAGMPDAPPDAFVSPCAFNPPPTPTGGTVEVGTGENMFTTITPGEDFQIYFGPQGAYYVWFNIRFQDMDPGDGSDVATRPQTKFSILAQDGSRVNIESCGYRLEYDAGSDGYTYLADSFLSELLPVEGMMINNTPLTMQVEVLDRTGKYAIDKRAVNALTPIPQSP